MTLTAEDRERIVTLEGAGNFRDFGGYTTECGAKVKRGQLFRSNRLSMLSEGDIETLEATGIATIFDLRAPYERDADPTVWQAERLTVHTWPPGHKRRLVDMAREYPQDTAGAQRLMCDFYAELPRTLGHAFGAIVAEIAGGAHPFVVHCSAGKDRTGWAAALILSILGVPRETVIADYTMTERIAASEDDMARSIFVGREGGAKARSTMRDKYPPEVIAVMLSARAEFLESAFAGIEHDYGSLDAYCQSIGVDDAMRERMIEALVEPA